MAPLISVFFYFFFRKDLCWGLGDFVPQVVDIQIGGSTVPQKKHRKTRRYDWLSFQRTAKTHTETKNLRTSLVGCFYKKTFDTLLYEDYKPLDVYNSKDFLQPSSTTRIVIFHRVLNTALLFVWLRG